MNVQNDFLLALQKHGKLFFPGAYKSYLDNQPICDWLLVPLARWAREAYGENVFEHAVRGYAQYCMHVAQAQRKYEQQGSYQADTLPEIVQHVYENSAYMTPYMWAAILIYPFWTSMTDHLTMFRDDFLNRLPQNPHIVELACGHGVMGLLAAEHRQDAVLVGYDISTTAIDIAQRLATVPDHGGRVSFEEKDVLSLEGAAIDRKYDGIMAAMLAEHLADPSALFASIARRLAPEGLVFFSTALESPQRDHIYEFHRESEPIRMAEEAGLRLMKLVCGSGVRQPGARFLPRAMAAIFTTA